MTLKATAIIEIDWLTFRCAKVSLFPSKANFSGQLCVSFIVFPLLGFQKLYFPMNWIKNEPKAVEIFFFYIVVVVVDGNGSKSALYQRKWNLRAVKVRRCLLRGKQTFHFRTTCESDNWGCHIRNIRCCLNCEFYFTTICMCHERAREREMASIFQIEFFIAVHILRKYKLFQCSIFHFFILINIRLVHFHGESSWNRVSNWKINFDEIYRYSNCWPSFGPTYHSMRFDDVVQRTDGKKRNTDRNVSFFLILPICRYSPHPKRVCVHTLFQMCTQNQQWKRNSDEWASPMLSIFPMRKKNNTHTRVEWPCAACVCICVFLHWFMVTANWI